MIIIASNQYYELRYCNSKNRVYWTMRGQWPSMSAVPDFDKDWDRTQALTSKGFTIFGDLSKLGVMPNDVKLAQDERQRKLLQAGCSKVACIAENFLTKISLNTALERSGMIKILRYFLTPVSAESWLDE